MLAFFQGAPLKHQVIEIGTAFYRESSAPLALDKVPKCVTLITTVHRELAHPPPDWQSLNAIVRLYRKGGNITPISTGASSLVLFLGVVSSNQATATSPGQGPLTSHG